MMNHIQQTMLDMVAMKFPNTNVSFVGNEIHARRYDGQEIHFFHDPYGGNGDEALALFPIKVFTINDDIVAQTNTRKTKNAIKVSRSQLDELLRSPNYHQFVLFKETNSGQQHFYVDDGYLSPTAETVGLIDVIHVLSDPKQVAEDFTYLLNVFINANWWGWKNSNESVSGYDSFCATLEDAEFAR